MNISKLDRGTTEVFSSFSWVVSGRLQHRDSILARFVPDPFQFIFISRRTVWRQIASDSESVVKQRKNKYFDIHPDEFGTILKIEIIIAGAWLEFETSTLPIQIPVILVVICSYPHLYERSVIFCVGTASLKGRLPLEWYMLRTTFDVTELSIGV
jgi:hypothetical protein